MVEIVLNLSPNENQKLLSECITCELCGPRRSFLSESRLTAQRPRALPRNAVEPSQPSQTVCIQSITGQPPSVTILAMEPNSFKGGAPAEMHAQPLRGALIDFKVQGSVFLL